MPKMLFSCGINAKGISDDTASKTSTICIKSIATSDLNLRSVTQHTSDSISLDIFNSGSKPIQGTLAFRLDI